MSKIKQFFRQSGLTKAQLLASVLCYFLCFALFLGIVVIWNPLFLSSTPTEDSQAADGPTNTGYWTDTGRYDISWYNNPDTDTYGDGSAETPYKISTAAQLAGLSYLVYNNAVESSDVTTSDSANCIFSDKYFEQTANIDLSAYYWQPIGILYNRSGTAVRRYFSGSYDGGNHTVSGVFTPAGSSNAYSYQGLFGYVRSNSSTSPITIKNIGITNSFIQGYNDVGGVVGSASGNTTISNCYNTGSVTGSGNRVGGVVGYAYNSITISNCYNTGTITGSGDYVGGVVGRVYASSSSITITNCYNTGSVNGGSSYVGGVVGDADSNTTITNCYNTGEVIGYSTNVGGVVGYADSNTTITNCYNTGSVNGFDYYVGGVVGSASGATITNCYNTGTITGSGDYVGGVAGYVFRRAAITNCYNTGSVSGSSSVGGVVGSVSTSSSGTTTITSCYYGANCLSTVGGINGADEPGQAVYDSNIATNAKTLSWYTDSTNWDEDYPWNFTTWVLDSNENDGYPNLKGYWISEGRYDISWLNENAGTAEDPYIIDSAEDLAGLSWLVYNNPIEYFPAGSDYVFENAYFSQTASISLHEYYWQPIGVDYDRSGERVQNFFAGNYNGNQNLIIGIHVPAGDTDAYANQGVFGSVRAYNYGVLIEGITAKFFSRISAYRQIGGIAGEAINFGHNSIIFSRCESSGEDYYALLHSSASDHSYVGGIVGYVTNGGQGDIIIEDCIGATSIRAEDNSGGIVGYASQNSNGEILIKNSFSTSEFFNNNGENVTQEFCGGIVGEGYDVTIVNCFSTGESIYGSVSSSSSVTDCYDTYPGADAWSETSNFWDTAHPWDFENVWMWNYYDSAYPMHRYNFWDENPANYSTDWYFNAQTIDGYAPGTKQNPYIIDSEQDLAGLAYLVNKRQAVPSNQFTNVSIPGEDMALDSLETYFCDQYILQTTDLDMSAYIWKPIGVTSAASNYDNYELKDQTFFAGNYDGGGHTISGLYTVGEDNGLFENLISEEHLTQTLNITQEIEPFIPVLQNIIIKDSGISGFMSGSIASQVRGAHILNCQNYSTISLSSFGGGIVGTIGNGSVIRNCYNYGNIINISGYSIGGIVGSVSEASAVITNCYNYGSIEIVEGSSVVGGVAGQNLGFIIDCHNAGDIYGDSTAAGIAGYHLSGRIDRCYNTGSVSGSSVGGVVGQAFASSSSSGTITITNCYNTGSVSGSYIVGGVVGSDSSSATITNCYNTGDVTGSDRYVGGVVGSASGTITNCYNTGDVSGYAAVGGVVGDADSDTTITNCYNTGSVSGSSNVGGVVGYAGGTGTTTITNCYYGGGVTEPLGNYGEHLSDIVNLAKNLSWYNTDSSNWNSSYPWDFAFTWKLESDVNDGYPILDPTDWWINEGNYSIEWYNNSDTEKYGDGSASNPYIIDSAEDLAGLSWLVYTCGQTGNPLVSGTDYSTNGSDKFVFADKHFLQTENIDMSAHVWQPIGIWYNRDGLENIKAFAGNYDGENNTVSGLSTPEGNITKCSYQGLFGYVSANTSDPQSSPTIKNVGIINSDISGSSDVGGVVGGANYDVILTNCYNTSLVSGYGSIGGVAGVCWGEMTGCYNAGTVTCLSDIGNVGGVVGQGSTLTNCYNTGTVNALGGNVGGLAGSTGSIVSKSYNAGNIILSVNSESGDVKVGGISSSSRSAINCFNSGSITVTINGTSYAHCNIYGITLIDGSGDGVSDCYNTGNITVNGGTNVTICGIAYVYERGYPKVFNSFNLGSFSTNSSANMHPITDAYSNNCYYADNSITDNSGATYLQDLTDKAKQQVWCEDTLAWDFTFCWKIDSSDNNGYPIFKTADDPTDWWLADGNYDTSWFNNSNPSLYGAGTKENPYKIKDAQDLAGLSYIIYHPEEFGLQSVKFMDSYNSYLVDVYFVQTADINLSAHTWQPIGVAYDRFTNEELNRAFAGNYDGQGYAISGIKTPSGSLDIYSFQGLFGIATGYNDESEMPVNTELKNIIITNSSIGGTEMIGSIVAAAYAVDLKNCQSSATIKGFSSTNQGIGGIVGGSGLGNVSNCSFFGTFEPGYIAQSESYISGIVGMAMMSTVENCDNFSSIVSDSSSNLVIAGIVGMAMSGTIIDCNNYGTLSGNSGVCGIAFYLVESTITNCGMFGDVILSSDGGAFVGFAGMTQNAQISNSVVDCVVRADGNGVTITAFVAMGTSDSGTFINLCSSNINVIGSGSVALAGIDANNSSLDDVATNSYVLISGENIETTKNITTVTETMEGNFVYLDGFKDGMPVPIKTDGTNFFHMHDFGSKTGIVEKVNDVLYPNLITEQFEIDSVYLDPNSSLDAPVLIEPEIDYLPYELDLVVGKEYVITFYVEGKKIVYKTTAVEIQNGKAGFAIGVSGDPIYIDSSGNMIAGYIMSGYRMNLTDGTPMDYSGKTWIMFGVSNNGQPLTEPKQIRLVSIRELSTTNLLDEPIDIQTIDPSNRPENLSPVEFQVEFDHNFSLQEGATYRVAYEFTPNGGETLNSEFTAQAVENSETVSDGSTQNYLFLSNANNENDMQLGQYMFMFGIMENVKYEGILNPDGTLSGDYNVVQTPGKSAIVAYVATQDLASFIVGTLKITSITLIG